MFVISATGMIIVLVIDMVGGMIGGMLMIFSVENAANAIALFFSGEVVGCAAASSVYEWFAIADGMIVVPSIDGGHTFWSLSCLAVLVWTWSQTLVRTCGDEKIDLKIYISTLV